MYFQYIHRDIRKRCAFFKKGDTQVMPTVKVNDINMYYELRGEGEPLVFITGLASDINDFV